MQRAFVLAHIRAYSNLTPESILINSAVSIQQMLHRSASFNCVVGRLENFWAGTDDCSVCARRRADTMGVPDVRREGLSLYATLV